MLHPASTTTVIEGIFSTAIQFSSSPATINSGVTISSKSSPNFLSRFINVRFVNDGRFICSSNCALPPPVDTSYTADIDTMYFAFCHFSNEYFWNCCFWIFKIHNSKYYNIYCLFKVNGLFTVLFFNIVIHNDLGLASNSRFHLFVFRLYIWKWMYTSIKVGVHAFDVERIAW